MTIELVVAEARALGYTGVETDYMVIADFLESRSELAMAALALEHSLESTPLWPRLRLRLAILYRKMGSLDLALQHLCHIYVRDPDHRVAVEYLLWTGIECGRPDVVADVTQSFRGDRYQGLLDELRVRIQDEPANSTLRFSLAWLLFREKKIPSAIQALLALMGDEKWGIWVHNLVGCCYSEREQPELGIAIHHFQLAVNQLGPAPPRDYHEFYWNLAAALARNGGFQEALEVCSKLLQLNPNYPNLAALIGQLCFLNGPNDEGGSARRGAGRRPPDQPPKGRERRDWPDDPGSAAKSPEAP